MAYTITYVSRKDIYGFPINTKVEELSIDMFLINLDRIGISDKIVFKDTLTNEEKQLK